MPLLTSGNTSNLIYGLDCRIDVNNVPMGFMKSITIENINRIAQYKSGAPAVTWLSVLAERGTRISGEFSELSAELMALSNSVSATPFGGALTAWPPAEVPNLVTFSDPEGLGVLHLVAPQPGIIPAAGQTGAPVLKSADGSSTYVNGTDYEVEPGTAATKGRFVAKGSAIEANVQYQLTFSTIPPSIYVVNTTEKFSLDLNTIHLQYQNQQTGQINHYYHSSMMINGNNSQKIADDTWLAQQLDLMAQYDANYYDPLGRVAGYGYFTYPRLS